MDPARKVSTGLLSSNGIITTNSVYLFDVQMTATAAGGWVSIYNDNTGTETSANQLIEMRCGTQYDSKVFSPNKYAGEGLEIQVSNATAVVYYR